MGALLYHLALVQDQDVVRGADGGEAVGDDEAGLSLHQGPHGGLDPLLGAGIHVGGGLIQNQHVGI